MNSLLYTSKPGSLSCLVYYLRPRILMSLYLPRHTPQLDLGAYCLVGRAGGEIPSAARGMLQSLSIIAALAALLLRENNSAVPEIVPDVLVPRAEFAGAVEFFHESRIK